MLEFPYRPMRFDASDGFVLHPGPKHMNIAIFLANAADQHLQLRLKAAFGTCDLSDKFPA